MSVLRLAMEKHTELIKQLAKVDDKIAELFLNDAHPSNAQLTTAIWHVTVSLKISSVFLGSAIKNTAVQPLPDGICTYLASPAEHEIVVYDTAQSVNTPPVELVPAVVLLLVALTFKLEEGRFGQLTYIQVYQGCLKKGQFIFMGTWVRRYILLGERMVMCWPLIFSGMMKFCWVILEIALTISATSALENLNENFAFLCTSGSRLLTVIRPIGIGPHNPATQWRCS
jgi:hypothetical protein